MRKPSRFPWLDGAAELPISLPDDGWMSVGDIRNDGLLFDDFVSNPDALDSPCDEFSFPPPPETSSFGRITT